MRLNMKKIYVILSIVCIAISIPSCKAQNTTPKKAGITPKSAVFQNKPDSNSMVKADNLKLFITKSNFSKLKERKKFEN